MGTGLEKLIIVSRLAVALAIFYLGFQISKALDYIPEIERMTMVIAEQAPPTLATMDRITNEAAAIRTLMPEVLNESAEIRNRIDRTLDEVARSHQKITLYLKQVEQLQQDIPQILDTTNRAIVVVNETQQQLTDLTPRVLDEIKLTRDMVNPTLSQVSMIVDKAFAQANQTVSTVQNVGQEASEGAIKGIVMGILKLPFRLLDSFISPLFGSISDEIMQQLTEQDIALMGEAGANSSKPENINSAQIWSNPVSGNSGSITLVNRTEGNNQVCVNARITILTSSEQTWDQIDRFCKNSQGKWALE